MITSIPDNFIEIESNFYLGLGKGKRLAKAVNERTMKLLKTASIDVETFLVRTFT